MSNKTNLPSLDDLSMAIAQRIYGKFNVSQTCPRGCCQEGVDIEDIQTIVKKAIIEKSLITNIGESRKDLLGL